MKNSTKTISFRLTPETLIAPNFRVAHANDACVDLMLMWKALSEGWKPPFITQKDRERLKYEPPSPERGFAGFFCSFRGIWFGGYAGADRVRLGQRDAMRIGQAENAQRTTNGATNIHSRSTPSNKLKE